MALAFVYITSEGTSVQDPDHDFLDHARDKFEEKMENGLDIVKVESCIMSYWKVSNNQPKADGHFGDNQNVENVVKTYVLYAQVHGSMGVLRVIYWGFGLFGFELKAKWPKTDPNKVGLFEF